VVHAAATAPAAANADMCKNFLREIFFMMFIPPLKGVLN
jgi:hypothetical protein